MYNKYGVPVMCNKYLIKCKFTQGKIKVSLGPTQQRKFETFFRKKQVLMIQEMHKKCNDITNLLMRKVGLLIVINCKQQKHLLVVMHDFV